MRLADHAATLGGILLLSLSSGCVRAYLPPPAILESTATLNVTVANLTGLGRLSIVPPGEGEKVILQNLNNPIGARIQTAVAAGQSARLVYLGVSGAGNCTLRVEFIPTAGQTYDIFVGDRQPPAPNGFFATLAQNAMPNGGRECVAAANEVTPGGTLVPISMKRWSVF